MMTAPAKSDQSKLAAEGSGGGAATMARDLSRAQICLKIGESEPADFDVTRYRGVEGLCQLYRFDLDISAELKITNFKEIIGQSASLSINGDSGPRFFHGIISRFEIVGHTSDRIRYNAELVPTLWLLTHRYSSRIFQNKTVADIISEVLQSGGIKSDRFRIDVKGSNELRDYCVQYRETDYNFIARLMEEEGIRWYFSQSIESHILEITDNEAYQACPNISELPFRTPSGMNPSEDFVGRFRYGESVRPGAVVLNDFDFENPKLNLQSKSDNGRDPSLEVCDYPGEYTKQSDGTRYAKLRAQEFEAARMTATGASNCVSLEVGKSFKLTTHPEEDLNKKYMITRLVHQGRQGGPEGTNHSASGMHLLDPRVKDAIRVAERHEDAMIKGLARGLLQIVGRLSAGDPTARRSLTQWVFHAGQVARDMPAVAAAAGGNPLEVLAIPGLLEDLLDQSQVNIHSGVYECQFDCIPEEKTFRPARVTPWPVMRGAQTARVVGPSNEEIYCDEYGRIKVQFNWDREGKFDEKSSCWIRVSQAMAGGQYGFMFLPRVGQEVVIDFLEGNPDSPLVIGRVFNADHMPPYKLPDEKTKSVIKTHSTKGGGGTNEIRFEDKKGDEQVLHFAEKNLHIRVKNDRVENIDHDRHLTVKANKFELVKESKHNEVSLDFNERVGGNHSLEVAGNVGEKFGGNHQEEASNILLKAGSNLVIDAGSNITLKVGGSFIAISGSQIAISSGKVLINSGGSPGSAPTVTPVKPETPVEADTVEAGKDTTYSGGEELAQAEMPTEIAGHNFSQSWIEVELVDEAGQPVVGEVAEVIGPDGELVGKSTTGANGVVRFLVDDPGSCQISFPNLDGKAWGRA